MVSTVPNNLVKTTDQELPVSPGAFTHQPRASTDQCLPSKTSKASTKLALSLRHARTNLKATHQATTANQSCPSHSLNLSNRVFAFATSACTVAQNPNSSVPAPRDQPVAIPPARHHLTSPTSSTRGTPTPTPSPCHHFPHRRPHHKRSPRSSTATVATTSPQGTAKAGPWVAQPTKPARHAW